MMHMLAANSLLCLLLFLCQTEAAELPSARVDRPVFPPTEPVGAYETRVAVVMEMSDAALAALVPEQNGMFFCGCPNCDGGTQDSQMVWNGPAVPERVHCRYCGMVYPNEKYPMNRTLEVVNRAGHRETWRYYEDSETGDRYYFSARARYFAKQYAAGRAVDLASAYSLTGKSAYARRAAVLLGRFAQVYPAWCVIHDYPAPGGKYPISNAQPPYPYWAGIWDRWHLYDTPKEIALAYDRVYGSPELDHVGRELGIDLRRSIEDGVLRANIAFQRTYTGESIPYNLLAPQRSAGFVLVGRVIDEPDFVHDGVQRLRSFCAHDFHADGMHRFGTVCYHLQMLDNCQAAADLVRGYSDPPGYRWPADGARLDAVELEDVITVLAKAREVPSLLTFPNRRVVAVHDTWGQRTCPHAVLSETSNFLPSYGHGRLAAGQGQDALHVHLHFSGGDAHQHLDNLNLILFARGAEWLSDIGYTHTPWRFWASGTASHNTVMIDAQDHHSAPVGGNLCLYHAGGGPVQVLEAEQPGSYPGHARLFRRRVILVRVSETNAYVVDIFRVAGGSRHHYFLHGNCDAPQTAELTLPLSDVEGTLLGPGAGFRLPARESDPGDAPDGLPLSFALFRGLREARTGDGFSVTWRFPNKPGRYLRTHVMGQSGCRVVLAQTPQIRPVQSWPEGGEDAALLDKHWRPSLVVERRGQPGLESVFVAVHEPCGGETSIERVKDLAPGDGSGAERPVLLAVTHAAGMDYIISCTQPGGEDVAVPAAIALQAKARLAVVRVQQDRAAFAFALDGDTIHAGDIELSCPAALTGTVTSVHRDEADGTHALGVTGPLPEGHELAGCTILVTHADGTVYGAPIQRVIHCGADAFVQLADDPGFEIEGDTARFRYYPRRDVRGPTAYRIDRSAFAAGRD